MNRIRNIFPYLITLALWHLSGPRFNPFGVVAIIPIFYYMFCDNIKHWFWFGFFMCFLLDYNAGTLFLFSSLFLFINAINDTYGILDNETGSPFNIKKFNLFMCAMVFFMFVYAVFNAGHFFGFLLGTAWLYLWLMILYIPFAALFRWVKNDR